MKPFESPVGVRQKVEARAPFAAPSGVPMLAETETYSSRVRFIFAAERWIAFASRTRTPERRWSTLTQSRLVLRSGGGGKPSGSHADVR